MDHRDHLPLLRPRDLPLLPLQQNGKQAENICPIGVVYFIGHSLLDTPLPNMITKKVKYIFLTNPFSDTSLASHHKRRETRGRGNRDGGEGEGELKKADRMPHDWMMVLLISVLLYLCYFFFILNRFSKLFIDIYIFKYL